MTRRELSLPLTVTLLAAVAVAFSATTLRAYAYEVHAFGGYRFGGKLRDANNVTGNLSEINVANGGTAGLSLGIAATPTNYQFELSWAHQFSELRAKNNVTGFEDFLGNLSVDYWHVGILYEFTSFYGSAERPPARTFVGLALGATRFGPHDKRYEPEWQFSGGLVLGVKAYANERVGFRAQVRLLTSYFSSSQSTFCSDTGGCFAIPTNGFMNQGEATGGLIIRF